MKLKEYSDRLATWAKKYPDVEVVCGYYPIKEEYNVEGSLVFPDWYAPVRGSITLGEYYDNDFLDDLESPNAICIN